jgi:hypothetical protein
MIRLATIPLPTYPITFATHSRLHTHVVIVSVRALSSCISRLPFISSASLSVSATVGALGGSPFVATGAMVETPVHKSHTQLVLDLSSVLIKKLWAKIWCVVWMSEMTTEHHIATGWVRG